ncbi:MAG: hypothetical protein KGL39_50560 [Patescibacteria group bacterium]|nr:hypothetical protein [Patescibacteria group bacterium]
MSEDLWMVEYDQIEDDFLACKIDKIELIRRLRKVGFDEDEIQEHLDDLLA